MRLGYLIPEFPLQTHIFFWREIVALREKGHHVSILSTRKAAPGLCKHAFAEGAIRETHYVYPPSIRAQTWLARHPMGAARALAYIASLNEASPKQRARVTGMLASAADLADFAQSEKLDHLHAHSASDGAHVLAMCERLGGPSYSLTLHGDLPVYGVDHRSKMERAVAVFTAGLHLKQQIIEQVDYPADQVFSTCMGVDTAKFETTKDRGGKVGALHMVTVARLDECKGHRFALKAMRQAVDAGLDLRYSIVGGGTFRPDIEKNVADLNLGDRVTFTGTMGEQQVLEVLHSADAFVLPSVGKGEAYPVSVMEAMSCSLPVVSSIIGATPEMITTDVDGILVKQEDVDGLAKAFLKLGNDLQFRKSVGAAARKKATSTFDVQVTAPFLWNTVEQMRARR